MAGTVKRINLPSGGWWEIETRPLWRHVREWADETQGRHTGLELAEHALASLTPGWSFAEEISQEAVSRRDVDDLIAVLEVFHGEVVSLLSEPTKEQAERLFGGLAEGRITPEFIEAHLLAATGWSWHTLQVTPVDVVQRMAMYLAVKKARDTGGTLTFADSEDSKDVD